MGAKIGCGRAYLNPDNLCPNQPLCSLVTLQLCIIDMDGRGAVEGVARETSHLLLRASSFVVSVDIYGDHCPKEGRAGC